MSTNFGMAYTVKVMQVSASHALLIIQETIGPQQLNAFKHYMKRYFSHKGIKAEKQVEKVLYNIDSCDMQVWVKENESELKALTFSIFIAQLKEKVLATNWMLEMAQTADKETGGGDVCRVGEQLEGGQ